MLGISAESWARVGVILVLFAWLFRHNFVRLWLKTNPFNGEANWSHSIFVPLIGLYYLFVHREDIARAGPKQFVWGPILRPARAFVALGMLVAGGLAFAVCRNRPGLIFSSVSPAGLAIAFYGVLVFLLDWSIATMLFGLAVFFYGIDPGQNDYLKDLGMVIMLFGIVLMLNGWNVMKIAWFPIAFLVCAIPWPGLVYSWVAEPLAQMAAHIGVDVLRLTGVDAVNNGTKIVIFGQIGQPPRTLNVAEACAGMRSLMTFIAIAGAVAFLPVKPLWQRLIIVASAIPIAIFCNMSRISVVGLLDHYVSTKWSDSFAHQFVGTVILFPALILIYLVGIGLEKIFIVEADAKDEHEPKPPKASAAMLPAIKAPVNAAVAPATMPAPQRSVPVRPQQAMQAVPPRPIAAGSPRPRPAPVAANSSTNNLRPPVTPPAVRQTASIPPVTIPPVTNAPVTIPSPNRPQNLQPNSQQNSPMNSQQNSPMNSQQNSQPISQPNPAGSRPPAAVATPGTVRTSAAPPAYKPVDPQLTKRPVTSPSRTIDSSAAPKAGVKSAAPSTAVQKEPS